MQNPPFKINKTTIKTPNGVCAFLSQAPFNMAFQGDLKENILKNRSAVIAPLSLENLAYLNQIHGNIILNARQGGLIGDGDGILITQKGVIGMVMVADCNPILLFDSQHKILLLLHAGRKGLQKGILLNALNLLQNDFHTNLQNLFIYIGPSIRSCCHEVQNDVFTDSSLDCGKIMRKGKIYLDLIAVIKAQLASYHCKNYSISPICTCCSEEYFSYRRDCNCGRFALFASLV